MRSKWSRSSGWQPSSNLPLHHLLQILTEREPGWTLRTTDRRSRKFFSFFFGTMEEDRPSSSPAPPAAQATTTKKSPMRRNPFSWDCVRTRRIRPLPPSPISDNNNNVMPESADDTPPKSGAGSRHAIPLLDGTEATPVHIPNIPQMHNQRPKASKFSSTAHR